MSAIQRLAATALLLSVAAQAQMAAPKAPTAPRVEAAWARPTVAGQSAGGGFLKITGGSANDRLIAASAGVAQAVELHTMAMDGNVMRMRPIDAIDVPAGGTVELQPGGRHVMFMGLSQPLRAGTRFPLTLRFEKAGELQVEVDVAVQAPTRVGR